MGLMVGMKVDGKIEENVIYHEPNKYTICSLKAVKRQSNQLQSAAIFIPCWMTLKHQF